MQNAPDPEDIRAVFRGAKAMLKAGAVIFAFCVIPPAGIYLLTGSLGGTAVAWLAGNLVYRSAQRLSPEFSSWMETQLQTLRDSHRVASKYRSQKPGGPTP
jgi:hypothetical protein